MEFTIVSICAALGIPCSKDESRTGEPWWDCGVSALTGHYVISMCYNPSFDVLLVVGTIVEDHDHPTPETVENIIRRAFYDSQPVTDVRPN